MWKKLLRRASLRTPVRRAGGWRALFRTSALVEDLKLFAGLEADGSPGHDRNFGSGARVASNAGFARLDVEDAEAAEFDPIALAEGVLHRLEDGIHGRLCFGPWKTGALDYALDEILLNQWRPPSCASPKEIGRNI